MAYPRSKTRRPWGERPRSFRKFAWIRLKNEIASHAHLLGGAFTTHDALVDASWADVCFLSAARRGDLYNATLDTALHAYFGRCESLAREASERALPYRIRSVGELFEKLPDGNYRLLEAPQSHVDAERAAFGGLTRHEWIDKEAARLADSGDVWVFPSVELDPSYRFGVGLSAILPVESLSIMGVDGFVRDFWARGERPLRVESSPMSYPSSRRGESRDSNALAAHPNEWVPPEEAAAVRHSIAARGERSVLDGELAGELPAEPDARARL